MREGERRGEARRGEGGGKEGGEGGEREREGLTHLQ